MIGGVCGFTQWENGTSEVSNYFELLKEQRRIWYKNCEVFF
jgi:hypothetical protein